MSRRFDAVLFDLLSGLLNSWALWDAVAGSVEQGRRWRGEYLRLTYATGTYRPYEDVVADAAQLVGLSPAIAEDLVTQWSSLQPWPEAPSVVQAVGEKASVGVVTNCSNRLGDIAVAAVGVAFDVVVTAERAGAYKPDPAPYLAALDALSAKPERVLFVAGSPYDIAGASNVGMPVWWHNRVGLSRDPARPPLAEHDSLEPLVDFV
jgi:2-haloacid dehalogenase